MVRRHQRQTQNQEGGIIKRSADPPVEPGAADPKDGKPTRVGFKHGGRWHQGPCAKRSGEVIDG
jgi:large subunit ribosomal protein L24